MNYLLYLAYGSIKYVNEAVYSILSMKYFNPKMNDDDIKVIIYTDMIREFSGLFWENSQVEYVNISNEMEVEWTSNNKYNHRMKIEVLRHFFRTHKGNVLLVDTDTYFLNGNIASVFSEVKSNKLIMHIMENTLERRFYVNASTSYPNSEHNVEQEVLNYCKYNSFQLDNRRNLRIPLTTQMWNSGVIGLNDTFSAVLDDILTLTDKIIEKFEYRIAEQLSFSYFFQNCGKLLSVDNTIAHYWYFRPCTYFLASFFYYNMNKLSSIIRQNKFSELFEHELASFMFLAKQKNILVDEYMDMAKIKYSEITEYSIKLIQYRLAKYAVHVDFLLEVYPFNTFIGKLLKVEYGR